MLDESQRFLSINDKDSDVKAKISKQLIEAILRRQVDVDGQKVEDGLQAIDRLVLMVPKTSKDIYAFHHYWLAFLHNRKPSSNYNPQIRADRQEIAKARQQQQAIDAIMTFKQLEFHLFGEEFERGDGSVTHVEIDADCSCFAKCVKRVTYMIDSCWKSFDIHKSAHSTYFKLIDELAELRFISRDLDVFEREFLEDCIRQKKSPFTMESLGRLTQANREKLCYSIDTERKANNSFNRRLLAEKICQWRIEDLIKKFEEGYSYGSQEQELVCSLEDVQAEINFEV
jgi:hypothetical protein